MSKLFEERVPFKPFEYPIYYNEGWLKQAQAFWLHTEIPMMGDVKDWNERLTDSEKNLVGNILLGFAQTECAVSDYWTNMVTDWFPKHEIRQMAMMFGSQETIHATAYSYLNETLGLDDFSAFLHEPAVAEKFELLTATSAEWKHTDLQKNEKARQEVGRSLAIFSAFAEGVSLYSSFAVSEYCFTFSTICFASEVDSGSLVKNSTSSFGKTTGSKNTADLLALT